LEQKLNISCSRSCIEGKLLKKRICVILGLFLIVLLCGAEASPHLASLVKADLPPPRTSTGLKDVVEDLTDATPPEDRVDSDGDGLYDKVENVIGTDFNNTDSDFDLLDDFYEVQIDSDPLDPDTNSDGLSDYLEVQNVPLDLDGDNSTNIWDCDNDGDGVNDGVDLSPFSKSILSDKFHFDVKMNGVPTYITLQLRPRNPESLKLYAQIWDWPYDTEGSMKDLDMSLEDVKVVPQLNLTVNVRPNQADVAEFGILVTDYGMHVPVYPIWENDDVVAFSAQIFYNTSSPLTLAMDAQLMWRVLGNTDEKAKALQACNGQYVSVGADGRFIANASEITVLETFQWLEVGENKVVLKMHGGPYLSVADDGSIFAQGSEIGAAQTFELVDKGNNLTCLKAYNGKYVSVNADGALVANSSTEGSMETFQVIDRGCLSDWTILVTYQEPFTLTGFTVSESFGCALGLFYSENRDQTVRANLLLGYDFLRNSTTHLQDMPSILANYGVSISSLINSFSSQEDALVYMSNAMLPDVLDSLPANQTLPVIMSVEERQILVEMSELSSGSYIMGSSYSVDLSIGVEPLIITKTLKTNFYETTGYKALEIEDIIRGVNGWQLSEEARFSLSSLMLAWNTGEQVVTKMGSQEVSWQPPEWLIQSSQDLEYTLEGIGVLMMAGQGIWAYKALQFLRLKGWNSASIARMLETGGKTGGFRLWTEMCRKLSHAKEGWAGIKGMKTINKIMKGLEVLGAVIDIGMSILSGFMLADQIGGHLGKSWGASFGIVATAYTILYTVVLFAIGEIPYVGPFLVLAIVLADIFGGFSDALMGWLMDLFGPDDLSVVEPWLEEIGVPKIAIDDKDGNGFDVGDRVSITLTTKSKVNVTSGRETQWAQYSWYRPYISINAPSGSFSNTSATGVPPTSAMNVSSGIGWKTEEFETGAWVEPGIGMPNFPVNVRLNFDYKLYHVWEHFVFYVFYWDWCRHTDVNQGISSSHLFTMYYDVLPETIDDFGRWRGITPLDHDYDGLTDTNETRSDPFRYDTDADGLNDKFETTIGTDAWNYDTDSDGLIDCFEVVFGTDPTNKDSDGDGLPDYLELSGYLIKFNYANDPTKQFTMRVFSDPRVLDTDGDEVDDYMEYWSNLNPRSSDTNGDGTQDVADPHFIETQLTFVRALNMTAPEGNLVDMDVDADGNLYVLRNPDFNETTRIWTDTVFKYFSNGTLIDSWQTGIDLSFDAIAVDSKNGYFYLAYWGNFINKYRLNGTFISRITQVSHVYVQSMDVDPDGYLYVSSGAAYYDPNSVIGVLKFAPNGTFVDVWGSRGDGPDKFHNIGKMAIDDKNGYIYVTDSSSTRPNRVTKWTKNGTYITTLPDGFGLPVGLEVDADGYVYVTDEWKDRLQKFDSNGMLIATWGNTGYENGNFTYPFQVTVDSGGYVYVADTSYSGGDIRTGPYPLGRIQKFSQRAEEKPPLDDPEPDRDGDGLLNEVETTGWDVTFTNTTGTFTIHVTSDPMLNDTDFDGLSDYMEHNIDLNPRVPDTDGDGVSDLAEYEWHNSPGMNPAHYDTDGEGLEDGTELTYTSNPTKPDTDEDGLSDLEEFLLNSDPNDTDTDDDGLSDYQEMLFNSSLTSPDSDNDFMFDGAELSEGTDPQSGDTDSDGLMDGHEVLFDTNPLNGDSDGDLLPDGFEVDNWLNPVSNDTDGDGLLDSTELEKGTNPWNKDSDFDGIPDGEDIDSNSTHITSLVLAFDSENATIEFAEKLAQYTNVTIVSKQELLANYTNSPYIVLVGRPDGNGTVGTLIHDLLLDSGDVLTDMMESDVNRLAVRYGLWNNTQTIVTLSTPYPSDHLRVLDILRSKTVTILPDSAIVKYNMSLAVHYSEGGSLNHTDLSSIFLSVDEIDTVKATDATLLAVLEEATNGISVQITRYNSSTTPSALTSTSGLGSYEIAIGKYLNVTVSHNLQNTAQDIINTALIQFYYKESDLDRNGNGILGDPGDIDENTLTLYFFDETSGQWIKLSRDLNWVIDFGLNTTNFELYGESYAGYVWASVSHLSLYGVAGLPYNRPPDVTNAYPSQSILWPPNKKPVPITIEGVTDPDGDNVTITITRITSNESITSKDAYGIGTDTAWLVADRFGNGNGRVYVITFVARDGKGGETAGSVAVYVPHDMGK
jgi:hypothetical protein